MLFIVELTNFRTVVYQGTSVYDATKKAEDTGFECSMRMEKTSGDASYWFYSPIYGWR